MGKTSAGWVWAPCSSKEISAYFGHSRLIVPCDFFLCCTKSPSWPCHLSTTEMNIFIPGYNNLFFSKYASFTGIYIKKFQVKILRLCMLEISLSTSIGNRKNIDIHICVCLCVCVCIEAPSYNIKGILTHVWI
jgi:hypothetical protein